MISSIYDVNINENIVSSGNWFITLYALLVWWVIPNGEINGAVTSAAITTNNML